MNSKLLSILTAFALALVAAAPALAQSTVFTYQGYLNRTGTPATGLHDFRFLLFNAATAGAQVGTTQCLNNITVTDGLFTVQIDFGQQFATTAQRHLEIQVRRDTGLGCNNNTGYTTLTPRQQLTAAPLASHANAAFALDAADGNPTNAVFVDNGGLVGIGTTNPAAPLHVVAPSSGATEGEGIRIRGPLSTVANQAYLLFENSAGTAIGYVGDGSTGDNSTFLASYVQDVELITPAGRVLTAKASGNVAIGTTTPLAKLDVRGDIRLGPTGQLRAASGEENLRILRGTVNEFGGILRGAGFTVDHPDLATYTIRFNVPFAAAPSVTATAGRDGVITPSMVVMTDGTTTAFVTLIIRASDDFWNDQSFSFTAVGPR